MTLAQPPFTYDDPRILYDETCFFYNGGFDVVCIQGFGFKTIGGSVSARAREEDLPFINIFIQVSLIEVNGRLIPKEEQDPEWFRFTGHNEVVKIELNNLVIDITKPIVQGKFLSVLANPYQYEDIVSTSFEGSKTKRIEPVIIKSEMYQDVKPFVVDFSKEGKEEDVPKFVFTMLPTVKK